MRGEGHGCHSVSSLSDSQVCLPLGCRLSLRAPIFKVGSPSFLGGEGPRATEAEVPCAGFVWLRSYGQWVLLTKLTRKQLLIIEHNV